MTRQCNDIIVERSTLFPRYHVTTKYTARLFGIFEIYLDEPSDRGQVERKV